MKELSVMGECLASAVVQKVSPFFCGMTQRHCVLDGQLSEIA
jgi:hypothetical protein